MYAYSAFALPTITVNQPLTITNNRTPLLNVTFNQTVNQTWFSIDNGTNTTACYNCSNFSTTLNQEFPQNTTGLVGWWKLNSVNASNYTLDSSGMGNDGKLYNGSTSCFGPSDCPQLVSGKFGNALNFNGVQDYVDAGTNLNLSGQTQLTLSIWIKTTSINQTAIVAKGSSTTTDYVIDIGSGGAGKLRFFGYNATGSLFGITSSATAAVNDGAWHNVAGVYDGTAWWIYIDGLASQTLTNTLVGGLGNTSQTLRIGARQNSGYFNGTIDEVRIYNRSLSAADVWNDYALSAGAHNVTVYANDSLGNVNSTIKQFTVDTTLPAITVQSPSNQSNQIYNIASVWFNTTANKALSWAGYLLDGAANVTLVNSSGNWNSNNATMIEGYHNVAFYANDSLGNTVSSTVYFAVDTIAPTITVNSPTNNTNYSTASVWFNASVYDATTGANWTGYSLDGGAPNVSMTTFWSDEFNGSSIDTTKWSLMYGNAQLGNGTVKLGPSSSGLQTIDRFNFQYGYIEIRAKLANSGNENSYASLLWMRNYDWNTTGPIGSIDIQEYAAGPDNFYPTQGGNFGRTWIQTNYIQPVNGKAIVKNIDTDLMVDQSQDFHTYAMEWTPDHLKFLFDGVEYHTFTPTSDGMNLPIPSHPMFINLILCRKYNASNPTQCYPATDNATVDAYMYIDYVRVWGSNSSGDWYNNNASMSQGLHSVVFYASDRAGNINQSGNYTFRVVDTSSGGGSSSSSGGGSSSSSGGGGSSGTTTRTIIAMPNDIVTKITVSLKADAASPSITVAKLTSVPIPAIDNAYQYFNITKSNFNNSDIANATIEFKVNKSWILANNITNVYLARYESGWSRLKTDIINETASQNIYRAYTDGFSYFAIVGEKAGQTNSTQQNKTAENDKGTTIAEPVGISSYNLGIIIVFVAGLLLVCAAYAARNKKSKRKR